MKKQEIDSLFFKTAVHQCNDLVIITDANAIIQYVNPAFEKHTGYRIGQIKGKNVSIVKSESHSKQFYKKLWLTLNKGIPVSQIFINKKKNGELYYENKTITPIKNKKGKIENFLSTSKDITNEINLRKKLASKQIFIENALKNTDSLIIGLNKDSKIVLFNKACEKITGYKFGEIVGKSIFEVLIPKTIRKEIKDVFEGVKKNNFKKVENKWITKSKKEVLIRWTNIQIIDENGDQFILSTGINISNEKAKESELMLLNAKLDKKVKERTTKIENLNKKIITNNKLLYKINTGIPAIIYIINIKTKLVTLVNNSISKNVRLPEKINSQIKFENFINYFSTPFDKKISLKSFCDEKINKEYHIKANDSKYEIQNKTVIFQSDSKNKPIEYLGFITDITSTKIIQNRLEESQKLAHIGNWEWNIPTNELYWSDEIFKIFEIDQNKFKPSYPKFLDTIYKPDRKLVEDAVNYSIENKTTYNITHRLEPKTGIIKYVTEKGFTEYDPNGKPIRMIGTVIDITEKEYIKERLEESQKLAKLGTWESNLKNGQIYWSKQTYEIFNLNPDNFVLSEKNIEKYIHPDDRELTVKKSIEAIKKRKNYSMEYRIITTDNKIKNIVSNGFAEYDQKGNPIRVLGTLQDVSEEKKLKNKLQSSFVTLENSLNAIFTNDLSGKIEYANQTAVKMWGFSNLNEMLSERPMAFDYWLPEEYEKTNNCIYEVLLSGFYHSKEPFKAIKKNGEIALMKFNISLIRDENGKPMSMTASFFDVTNEVKINNEIKKYDKKINLLLNNINEVVFGADVINGEPLQMKLFFLSEKSELIIGYSFNDVRKNPKLWISLIHPEDISAIERSTKDIIKTKNTVIRFYRLKHKITNQYIWLEETITPIFDSNNVLISVYGSARDVTERKKLELNIIESEIKYRSLFEKALVGIFRADSKTQRAIDTNDVCVKMFGYDSKEDALENFITSECYVNPNDREILLKEMEETGSVNNKELKFKRKNGTVFWGNISVRVIEETGQVEGAVVDVTERKKLEKKIKSSEEKYRSLFENALVGIFRANISTKKAIDANEICIKLFGYDSKEDALNNFITNECYEDEKIAEIIFDEIKKVGYINNKEVSLKRKNGSVFWGNLSVKIVSEEGVIEGVVIDITERKNLELKIRKSEEKYRLLSDNNNDLITLRDANGKAIYVSKSVKTILGYTHDEYSKINLPDLLHPDDKDTDSKIKKYGTGEARIRHKDGHYIWMQAITNNVYDNEGKIINIIGSSRDITERKKLEINLSESEKKYKSIFENSLAAIFRININTHKITEANELCAKLFGYDSKEDFLQNFKPLESYYDPTERNLLFEGLKKLDKVMNQRIRFKQKNGKVFWSDVSAKFLNSTGDLEGVFIDVTKNVNFENQLQKNIVEKELLIKEVHHRVKNNLQIISSLLKLQSNKITDNALKEPLIESRERIKAIALIHEKLYLSDDLSTINFSDYIKNLTKSMHSLNSHKKINVIYDLVEFITDINIAIPLGLACYEIISNSFKHAFNSKINANLNVSIKKTNSGHQINISDTGSGFQINLIDPKNSLGWNLITNLTKQAKGMLTIKSEIGVGSEFIIAITNA